MHTLLKNLSWRLGWGTRYRAGRDRLLPRFRPGLESLERRDVMSVTIPGLFNTGVDNSETCCPRPPRSRRPILTTRFRTRPR